MTSALATPCTGLRGGAACSGGRIGPRRGGDAVLAGPTWFAVADGIGGARAADIASRTAIAALEGACVRTVEDVDAAMGLVNDAVRDRACCEDAFGTGSTIVAATDVIGGVAVVHVGDSRCYRLVDGRLTLVTHDHSLVQELCDLGTLTRADALLHPMRHVITRAIGIEPTVHADIALLPRAACRLLLCSDGLSGTVTPQAIGRVMAGLPDPGDAAERLVELSVASGATDDVSAVIVDVAAGRPA